MKKLTAAQQKVIDSIKASAAKFAGKTYEEAYPRVEDRNRWSKKVYEKAQKGHYLVEAHPNTIAALLKAGIIEHEDDSLFYGLVEDKKEEETMTTETMNTTTETIELKAPVTFERANGLSPVTLVKAEKRWYDHQWHFVDTDSIEWYRNPNWDNDECLMAFYMMDSSRGQEIQISTDTYEALINNDWEIAEETTTTTENEKEETTMKPTNTKIDLNNATATFTLFDGITYTYHIESRRYSKTEGGKTKRIGKAEYESAKHEYEAANELASMAEQEQAELDKDPCRVDRITIESNFDGDTHFWTVRVNGKAVSNHYSYDEAKTEASKLGWVEDGAQDPELEQIMDETGLEPADAELERNVRNEQKKPSKPRRSKDIAYEGNGVTLTAKQVDFLRELRKTEALKEDENDMVIEDITITIGGQFEDRPMTVGAMISTLCEKSLGTRIKAKVGNRTMTLFGLTPSGKDIMDAIK